VLDEIINEILREVAFHILYLRWLWATDQFADEFWMWFDLFHSIVIAGKVLSYNTILMNEIKSRLDRDK